MDTAPPGVGLPGGLRSATSIVFHSVTSKDTLTPQAARIFRCMYSFIGSGGICPEPEVEISTLKENGRCGVKPASASSALPRAGSKLQRLAGWPKAGSVA